MVNAKGTEYRKKENIKRFFYPKEWIDFIDACPEQLKFFYNILMQTGARYHELSKVKVEDVNFERNFIEIKFPKTRIGGMKKIKIICIKCKNRSYISKSLKFCQYCGELFTNLREIEEQYKKQIINRRKEIRNVKISDKFKEEIKTYIKIHKLEKKDEFPLCTIQHLRQAMHRILIKIRVNDWKDFSPHNIRKTHENYLIATGSNPMSLRMHMGHAIDVATAHYISANVFTQEEIGIIKIILGGLKI